MTFFNKEDLLSHTLLVERSQGHIDLIDIRRKIYLSIPLELQDEFLSIFDYESYIQVSAKAEKFLHRAGIIKSDQLNNEKTILENLKNLDSQYAWYLSDKNHQSDLKEIYRRILDAHSCRKLICYSYLQGPSLPETSFRQALLISSQIPGNKILCMGDDNFVSIGLASLGHQVTVVDCDKYLLRLIDRKAKEYGLQINTILYDLKDSLPQTLLNNIDLITMDPVSSENWFKLFLSRSISCLKSGGHIYLTVYEDKEDLARRLASELKLAEIAFHKSFSHYYDEFIRYDPSLDAGLLILEKNDDTVKWVFPDRIISEDFFDNAASFLNSYFCDFYECELSLDIFNRLCLNISHDLKIVKKTKTISESEQTYIFQGSLKGGYFSLIADIKMKYVAFDLFDLDHPNISYKLIEQFKQILLTNNWKVYEKTRYVKNMH